MHYGLDTFYLFTLNSLEHRTHTVKFNGHIGEIVEDGDCSKFIGAQAALFDEETSQVATAYLVTLTLAHIQHRPLGRCRKDKAFGQSIFLETIGNEIGQCLILIGY